jgi:hypothetical protein
MNVPKINPTKNENLGLDNEIKRWAYVQKDLGSNTTLELHVRAVVAGLIVLAEALRAAVTPRS